MDDNASLINIGELSQLDDASNPLDIEDDWLTNFFEKMQTRVRRRYAVALVEGSCGRSEFAGAVFQEDGEFSF